LKTYSLVVLWNWLDDVRKRQFFGLACLALLASVAEMLSLGAVTPFLAVLSDPAILAREENFVQFSELFWVFGERNELIFFAAIFAMMAP